MTREEFSKKDLSGFTIDDVADFLFDHFEQQLRERDERIAMLKAKLKRYENPVVEYVLNGFVEDASIGSKHEKQFIISWMSESPFGTTSRNTNVKYHVIVLEGGE